MEEYLSNAPDFRDMDFESMMLRFDKHEFGEDIFHEFPILANYKVFFKKLEKELPIEHVIQYIGFCFDKGSPFLKKYNDVVERRFWAVLQAGFQFWSDSNRFHPIVDDMIRGKNPDINLMIVQYCLLQGDEDYITFVAYNEALKSQLTKLINIEMEKDITDNIVKTITANIKQLRGEISEIRRAMFFTEKDHLLNASLYDFMESKSLGLSPEAYAERMKKSREYGNE